MSYGHFPNECREHLDVVCICGSMRFMPDMLAQAVTESLAGHVVVMPLVNMKTADPRWADERDAELIKTNLDLLHMEKISMAKEVVVVTRDGYIGESTRREIDYAESIGVPVRTVDFAPTAPAPKTPCPEGFHWLGQPFTSCDKCGLPAWEHAGEARLPEGASPFSLAEFVLRPWGPGQADRIRAKWDPNFRPADTEESR